MHPPTDPADNELIPIMTELFARAPPAPTRLQPGAAVVRQRLLERVSASRAAHAGMFTVRRRRAIHAALGGGATAQTLYAAQPNHALRPGEPLRARLIQLPAGAHLDAKSLGGIGQLASRHREWLVLAGGVQSREHVLAPCDYLVTPAGYATPNWSCEHGAVLFLRESEEPGQAADLPFTVHDASAGWPQYAPGIQRRVLWQRDGRAALLYLAQPGAQVPHHSHGHDEECLMLQGELFLDDVLLQPGDYQLAPAGTGHRITETDTGAMIYAHGDLEMKFVATGLSSPACS